MRFFPLCASVLRDIVNQTLSVVKTKDMDVHTRIMKANYKDCPEVCSVSDLGPGLAFCPLTPMLCHKYQGQVLPRRAPLRLLP